MPHPSLPPAPDTPPRLELDGPRATLRLNRPSQHNRLDPDDLPVLEAHLDAALARPDPAVLERRYLDSLASPALRGRLERLLGD